MLWYSGTRLGETMKAPAMIASRDPELESERIYHVLSTGAAASSRRYILADLRGKLNFLCLLIFRFRLASNPVQLFYRNHGHNTIARRSGMAASIMAWMIPSAL